MLTRREFGALTLSSLALPALARSQTIDGVRLGVQTYSFRELAGVTDERAQAHTFQIRWDHVLFGRERSPIRPPSGARPECKTFLAGSLPTGPPQVITNPEDDPPFLFYSSTDVPIQFHELNTPPAP